MHAQGPVSVACFDLALRVVLAHVHVLILCSNIMHGSDSVDSANHEIGMWFTPAELIGWTDHSYNMIYE